MFTGNVEQFLEIDNRDNRLILEMLPEQSNGLINLLRSIIQIF